MKIITEIIKKKKEFSGITNRIVEDEVDAFLKQQKKVRDTLLLKERIEKSSAVDLIVKYVRGRLHRQHGIFQDDSSKRAELAKKIKNIQDVENCKVVLETHTSTKERISYYSEFYKKIFSEIKNPKTILDLGCGMNPFSIPFMDIVPVYYANDINEEDCIIIQHFFEKVHINGSCEPFNLQTLRKLETFPFPSVDVCFLFKVLDSIETTSGHKFAEKIITHLQAKYTVVTFATKTVSGKNMIHPYRGWIERMLDRRRYSFKRVIFPNELVYIIKKGET